jgi:hypothetical protein
VAETLPGADATASPTENALPVRWRISKHTRVAADGDGAVLLDLRSGRYLVPNQVGSALLLGLSERRGLDEVVVGLAESAAVPREEVATHARRFLSQLVEAELIEPDRSPASPETLPPPEPPAEADTPVSNVSSVWLVPVYLCLAAADLALRILGFARVHRLLHRLPHGRRRADPLPAREVADLVARAAAFYPWRTRCLPRSVAVLLLLRLRGWPARLALGAKRMPFAAHAWVEVGDVVVTDSQRVRHQYAVLERC